MFISCIVLWKLNVANSFDHKQSWWKPFVKLCPLAESILNLSLSSPLIEFRFHNFHLTNPDPRNSRFIAQEIFNFTSTENVILQYFGMGKREAERIVSGLHEHTRNGNNVESFQ